MITVALPSLIAVFTIPLSWVVDVVVTIVADEEVRLDDSAF